MPRFSDLAEIVPYAKSLRAGHVPTGRWSLAQICRHLADSFTGSMDGFGVDHHRVMRGLFGRRALKDVFQNGLSPGFTVTERLNPPPDADFGASVEDLETAIERFQRSDGPLHMHPFFGRLDRSEWERLHLIHCAHHLGYMKPQSALTETVAHAETRST